MAILTHFRFQLIPPRVPPVTAQVTDIAPPVS